LGFNLLEEGFGAFGAVVVGGGVPLFGFFVQAALVGAFFGFVGDLQAASVGGIGEVGDDGDAVAGALVPVAGDVEVAAEGFLPTRHERAAAFVLDGEVDGGRADDLLDVGDELLGGDGVDGGLDEGGGGVGGGAAGEEESGHEE